jgi:hypothetical protein
MRWLDQLLCWVTQRHTWLLSTNCDAHVCVHCQLTITTIQQIAWRRRHSEKWLSATDAILAGPPRYVSERELRALAR